VGVIEEQNLKKYYFKTGDSKTKPFPAIESNLETIFEIQHPIIQ
jgi:hypothetical protein